MISIQYFATAQDIIDAYGSNIPSNVVCIAGNNDSILLNSGNNNPHTAEAEQDKTTIVDKIKNQNITVDPTEETIILRHDDEYTGLGTVTITGIQASRLMEYITENGEYHYTPEEGHYYTGIDIEINVQPELQDKEVDPSREEQVISYDEGKYGLRTVTVKAVTAEIDPDIKAENIRKGVEILGVYGTFEPIVDNITITPTTARQSFVAPEGVDGYDKIFVEPVTAEIDENIKAENIKKDVNILGIVGEYDVDLSESYMALTELLTGFAPVYRTLARWNAGTATVNGGSGFWDQVTDGDVDSLENINWRNSLELTELYELDTYQLKDYNNMFNGCSNLTYINPEIQFYIFGKQMQYMFEGCRNLTSLPDFTDQAPTNLYHFTRGCEKITELPMMDTSQCISFNSIVGNWTDSTTGEVVDCGVTVLPDYDFGAVTSSSGTNLGTSSNLRLISGFRNLGKGYTRSQTVSVGAQYQPNLERQSAWNIVNSLWDFNQEGNRYGVTSSTLNFTGWKAGWNITDEEEAELVGIGAAKGWTININ